MGKATNDTDIIGNEDGRELASRKSKIVSSGSTLIRGRIQASGIDLVIGYQGQFAGLCVVNSARSTCVEQPLKASTASVTSTSS